VAVALLPPLKRTHFFLKVVTNEKHGEGYRHVLIKNGGQFLPWVSLV
jgi:hypothetical protein